MLQQYLVVESVYARALLHGTLAQSGADAAKQSQPCRLTELVVSFGCNITTKSGEGHMLGLALLSIYNATLATHELTQVTNYECAQQSARQNT